MPDEDKRLAEEEAPSVDAPAVRRRRRLIIISSLIFALRFLALAAFFPYIFLWLESNGFDTHERGVLGALSGLFRFVSPMAVGSLADWSGRRRLIFVLGVVGNACCTAALPLAPRSFGAQALLLAFGGLVEPGALVDAFVMRSLAWAGAAGAAAKARAFGAFSWSAAAPLFGALSSQLGIPALFWAYCAMNLCVCLPVVLLLPIEAAYREVSASDSATSSTAAPGAGPAPAPQESFVRRARHALGGSEPSSRLLRFCAPVIALVGFQMGIGFAWGFIYLKQGLHASGVVVGLSLTFQAAVEVPIFRLSGWLIEAFGGVRPALLTTSLAGALRMCGWWAATDPLAVLPFEVGHGWSFALAYSSMSQVADAFAAAGLQATVVGLLNSAMQVGQLLSTLGWGLVVEGVGLRASFGAAALVFAVASLPLVPHLPGCARGVARALRGALRRSVARRREAAGLVGIKELKGLPPADPEAWAGEAVAS